MNAIIVWSLFLLFMFTAVYILTHNSYFPTVHADMDEYGFSSQFTEKYGGVFKTPGYKLRHNDVIFVRPTKDTDKWQAGDILVVDTGFNDFARDGLYLFRQGKTYRIATCISVDKIGTFPPLFDGHETLITHDCMGRVIGRLQPPHVEMF